MENSELLEQYEAFGEEELFVEAKRRYEEALAEAPDDPQLLLQYGYLLECHGRNEIREAAARYERAIEVEPSLDKLHYQLITARCALFEPERVIPRYEDQVSAAPEDVREYRFLACAYLLAGRNDEAGRVVDAGLELSPDDRSLIASRGEVKAAAGDVEGALADWRRAVELDPEDIGPVYSSAFLLEREGRLEEAVEAWRYIVAWNESRGFTLQAAWPKRELRRLSGAR